MCQGDAVRSLGTWFSVMLNLVLAVCLLIKWGVDGYHARQAADEIARLNHVNEELRLVIREIKK